MNHQRRQNNTNTLSAGNGGRLRAYPSLEEMVRQKTPRRRTIEEEMEGGQGLVSASLLADANQGTPNRRHSESGHNRGIYSHGPKLVGKRRASLSTSNLPLTQDDGDDEVPLFSRRDYDHDEFAHKMNHNTEGRYTPIMEAQTRSRAYASAIQLRILCAIIIGWLAGYTSSSSLLSLMTSSILASPLDLTSDMIPSLS